MSNSEIRSSCLDEKTFAYAKIEHKIESGPPSPDASKQLLQHVRHIIRAATRRAYGETKKSKIAEWLVRGMFYFTNHSCETMNLAMWIKSKKELMVQ